MNRLQNYTDENIAYWTKRTRRNAGGLAEKICFQQMNAEELSFPGGSFDVGVSRNLTWNLGKPEQAYAQWDQDILGMKVSADTEVWKQDEWISNASTPMFPVTASRTV